MFFQKRLLSAALVVAMGAALLYGSTLPISTQETSESTLFGSNKETIYCWYSDESLTTYVSAAAVAFGEENDVRVIPVLSSESEYLEAINDASLHSEAVPDVYLLSHDDLEKAYLAGLSCEVPDTEGILNAAHFPDAALRSVTYENRLIAYPVSFETSALVYNETYLETWAEQQAEKENGGESDGSGDGEESEIIEEETATTASVETATTQTQGAETTETAETTEEGSPEVAALAAAYMADGLPDTIDEILSMADTFDAPEGVEGVLSWDVSDILYNYWIVGHYMTVGGEDGDDRNAIDINNEETLQCLTVYQELNQFFSIESDTVTYDSVMQDFIDGKVMFTIATSDALETLAAAKEEGSLAYDYGFATMPDVSTELSSRSLSLTTTAVVNGYTAHKELADRFGAYLAETYASQLYERSGKLPASLSAQEATGNEALLIFAQEYADSIPLPKLLETGNFWMQLELLFAKVWDGEDISTLLTELSDTMTTQLAGETTVETRILNNS